MLGRTSYYRLSLFRDIRDPGAAKSVTDVQPVVSDHAGGDESDGQSQHERGDQHTDEHAVVDPVHIWISDSVELTVVLDTGADGQSSVIAS